MKRLVGLTADDAGRAAGLADRMRPRIPSIIRQFLAIISADPTGQRLLTATPDRTARLRQGLREWMEDLFSGDHDESHFRRSLSIGRTHVRIALPQDYMFTGMHLIRRFIFRALEDVVPSTSEPDRAALEKLLDLELAVMNLAYNDNLVDQVQQSAEDRYNRQLGESRHLALVGELAAAIAHEVKNPLAGISGAIQVIRASLDEYHPHREIIDEALLQIDRLDAVVEDLLVYARPKPPMRSQLDLNGLLRRVMIILQQESAFQSIDVRLDLLPGHIEVEADEGQIQQVLMNIMLNAAHACGPDGRINCRIRPIGIGARIEIEDNGMGIADEIRDRVWEPFFTTRAKGTGLGLAISKRIVEAHDGVIRLESKPGEGTRVMIDLAARSKDESTPIVSAET